MVLIKEKMEANGIGSMQTSFQDLFSPANMSLNPFYTSKSEDFMEGGITCLYQPSSLTSSGPWNFDIRGKGSNNMLQMNQTRILTSVKIVKNATNDELDLTDYLSIVNLFGNSLIKSIDIDINGVNIPALSNNHYNYKSYIETILSYGMDACKSQLVSSGYYPDKAGLFDEMRKPVDNVNDLPNGDDGERNEGFRVRAIPIQRSAVVQFVSTLHSDFMHSSKCLIPDIDMRIRINREDDKFLILSAENKIFKIEIVDMKMELHWITINNILANEIQKKLNNGVLALYEFNKTEISSHSIANGFHNGNINNLHVGGILPKSITVVMVDENAMSGDYKKNPYNFKHFDNNLAYIKVNGQNIPADPYTPNFDKKLYQREYRALLDNSGISHNDAGINLNPNAFANGSYILKFDLSPDKCNGWHKHKKRTGSIDLILGFAKPLPNSINIIIMKEFDATLTIDKNKTVVVDYAK